MDWLRKFKIGTRLYTTFAVVLIVYVFVVISGTTSRMDTIYDIENRITVYLNLGNTAATQQLLEGIASDMRTSNTLIGAASAFMLVVVVLLLIVIVRSIVVPVNDLLRLVSNVREGNLRVNTKKTSFNDEVEHLTQDIYTLVGTLQEIESDAKDCIRKNVVEGDVDYRIATGKYQGGYRDIVEVINDLINSNEKDVDVFLSAIANINNGEFNVHAETMPGKKVILNQMIDSLRENLISISGEIGLMIEAAVNKGDMQFSIDESKYKGDWQKITKGLNDIAAAVDAPIVEIRDVMDRLAGGYFNKTVQGDYPGDFLAIKNDVNGVVDSLRAYINEIDTCLSALATGDLTRRTNMNFEGDFARIQASINNINNSLHKTISEIDSAASQVFIGTKQISTSATDLANGATEQAGSIEELNASIDMITQQTQQNASNAQEANELSNTSTENANSGNAAMKQMLESMLQIKESSNNISRINNVIQDIAFQTNLLALNAAVEAARAGDHGKGFAVVAEEVRSLAARSQAAATDTNKLIQDSIERVEGGSEIAGSTSEALDMIVSNASEVLQIIGNISTASMEQAEAISQVSVGLAQISDVVQSNSSVSEQTAAAAQELSSQAELLKELVAYFKL